MSDMKNCFKRVDHDSPYLLQGLDIQVMNTISPNAPK